MCIRTARRKITTKGTKVSRRFHEGEDMGIRVGWRSRFVLALSVGVFAGSTPSVAQGNVVKYQGTIHNVKYVYATAEPVARLKPGDILDTNTLDCVADAIRNAGATLRTAAGDSPLPGPLSVEGG